MSAAAAGRKPRGSRAETKKRGAIAVTGANRGIGAAIALELARRGFTVACLSRAGKGVEELAVPKRLAGRLLAGRCDVKDEASVARALRSVASRAGRLRGVVNNAGIQVHGAGSGSIFRKAVVCSPTNQDATCYLYRTMEQEAGRMLPTY